MESLAQDLKFALRTLAKRPGFTSVAVVTLALGIGATTAIFSVVNGVLLEPLPIEDSGRVVVIDRETSAGHVISVSIPTFQDWRDQNRVFEHTGAFRWASANLTGEGEAERLLTAQVTSGFFAALGRSPLTGRLLGSEADEPGAPLEVVIGEDFWQRRFAGDPEIAGRTMRLDGKVYTVIGVMPSDFAFPSAGVELWTPLGAFSDTLPWDKRGFSPGLWVTARLAGGVSFEQVREDMDAVTARIAEITGEEEAVPRVRTLREVTVGDVRAPLVIVLGAVGFVLLIACVNVAGLLMARGESRQLEIATRLAVGASRGRLVRQMLVESLVLAAAGGALGLAAARLSLRALVAWLPAGTPLLERVAIDPAVLAFTSVLALATGVAFGLVPALRCARLDFHDRLRQGSRHAGGRAGLRRAMVVGEMAVAVVLLVGAGLLVKSFRELRAIDPGFRAENVLTLQIALPQAAYGEPARWDGFYDRLLEDVSALPGVEHAGINNVLPLASGGTESGALPEGLEPSRENVVSTLYQAISADYFQAMGIPLLEGRSFDRRDAAGAAPVAIVDETMAERFWPGESAIGKRVAFEYDMSTEPPTPRWREVIGVAGHVRHYELENPSRIELYAHYPQMPIWLEGRRPSMALVIRASVPPSTLLGPVRAVVREIDPQQPIFGVQTMTEVLDAAVAQERLLADLLVAFSVLSLALAAIGVYGLLAWVVGERTREIGVRMAFGARRGQVLRLVLAQGMKLAAAGLAVGLLAAFALSRVLVDLLYGVTPADPGTYALVPLILALAAGVACLVPAWRAARVDPLVALRYE